MICTKLFVIKHKKKRLPCILAGKTTLLKILAGKHMVGGKDVVRVLDFSSFHDTHLVCSGDLSYLGGSWTKTIGSAVSSFALLLCSVL